MKRILINPPCVRCCVNYIIGPNSLLPFQRIIFLQSLHGLLVNRWQWENSYRMLEEWQPVLCTGKYFVKLLPVAVWKTEYSWLGLVSFKAEFENVSWLLLAFFDKVVQERDGLREESLPTDSDRYRKPRDSGTLRVENETASNHFKVWPLKHSLRTETRSRAQPPRQNLRANKCRSLC